MIDYSYFEIQQAVEEYGIKNIRVFIPETPNDFTLFQITGIPISFSSNTDEKQVWVEYKLDPNDYHKNHKVKLIPSEKYEIPVTSYGNEVGKTNLFPNVRKYVSDLNHNIRSGYARVYVETEDGLQLIYGVYEEVLNNDEIKALEWSKNFFNEQFVQSLV